VYDSGVPVEPVEAAESSIVATGAALRRIGEICRRPTGLPPVLPP
jgi:hypothetical protein